jgi:hypothetical protein
MKKKKNMQNPLPDQEKKITDKAKTVAKHVFPPWVEKHRKPGVELRNLGGRYYVYEVSSYYDPKTKRTKKKTGKYLGSITESDGFKAATFVKTDKKAKVDVKNFSIREYGFYTFIMQRCSDIVAGLQQFFPDNWLQILIAAYCRIVKKSPIKNMEWYYQKSFFSVEHPTDISSKLISELLRDLGVDRTPITNYMTHKTPLNKLVLMDATSMVSYSQNLSQVSLSLSKNDVYEPIFNLLYIYSPDMFMPVYYRIFNGNIKDVKMMGLAIKECPYNNTVIVADKGFYYEQNLITLEDESLQYIIPLRRNSTLIKTELYEQMPKTNSYFIVEGKIVWYAHYPVQDNRYVHLFLNEELMAKEKKDFLARIETHPLQYTMDKFHEQRNSFGTLAIITNMVTDKPEEVYKNYKSRQAIEILFDEMKNILGHDYTYMRDDHALEGWMFINHIALQINHRIYSLLKESHLLKNYSIRDLIEFLAGIKKARINDTWYLEPIITKHQNILKKINVSVT